MKRMLVIVKQSPYKNSHVSELFDEALVAAVFEFDVSVLFLGDGVWCLQPQQNPLALGTRSIANMMLGFETYDISKIFVCEVSFNTYSIDNPVISSTIVTAPQIQELIQNQDLVVTI